LGYLEPSSLAIRHVPVKNDNPVEVPNSSPNCVHVPTEKAKILVSIPLPIPT
jgi:hypothetical protein